MRVLGFIFFLGAIFFAQSLLAEEEAGEQRWLFQWQATSIGQLHGQFRAPYTGANSLQPYPERAVSLTSTIYLGFRLDHDTQVFINPELAGGRGFSNVTGLANSHNGELPRVDSATPKPYFARAYISHDFGFGSEREQAQADSDTLAGSRPMNRYTIAAGRFTLTDFFDDNRYSHDPRTQFMGWGVMYNGAWDYPADVRGYTWGIVHDVHLRDWSFRLGSGAEPRVANGLRFDRRILRNRGDVGEVERRFKINGRDGTVRVLAYRNRANAGTYADAIRLAQGTDQAPDVTLTRRNGTVKYGYGLSADQEVAEGIGVFTRAGWNDGQTESFAFTAIDRLFEAGVSVNGARWRRKKDTAASVYTVAGLAPVHADYLARGGMDFIIGDGQLNYGTERIWESYYSTPLFKGFVVTFDLQYIVNPGFNRDRGPLWVPGLRLRLNY